MSAVFLITVGFKVFNNLKGTHGTTINTVRSHGIIYICNSNNIGKNLTPRQKSSIVIV